MHDILCIILPFLIAFVWQSLSILLFHRKKFMMLLPLTLLINPIINIAFLVIAGSTITFSDVVPFSGTTIALLVGLIIGWIVGYIFYRICSAEWEEFKKKYSDDLDDID